MENITRLQLAAALLLIGLSVNALAADSTVTNGGTLARAKYVQTMTATEAASISLVKPATDLLAWEIWNTGTNTITITNGITGYQPVLSAGLGVILRGLTTNAWLTTSFDDGLLDLAGTRAMTGNSVTLARDVKSRDATYVGLYGAAMGYLTTATNYGAAFGYTTTAGEYGAAFGWGSTAGEYGTSFGFFTSARNYGASFGAATTSGVCGASFGGLTTSGDYGFGAGYRGKGANGSFVFSDSIDADFDRLAFTNWFSVRASGGTYFETPDLTVTGSVTAASYGGAGVTNIWVITGIETNGSGAVTGITSNSIKVLK